MRQMKLLILIFVCKRVERSGIMFNKLHKTAVNSEIRLPRFNAIPNAMTVAKIPKNSTL